MQMMRWFLRRYLATRAHFLVGFLGFMTLIGLVSYLFEIERAVVAYTLILLFGVVVLVFAWDFRGQWRSCQQALLGQQMPTVTPVEDVLWHKQGALREQLEYQTKQEIQHRKDLEDYYTLWAHQMKVPIAASQLLVEGLPAGQDKQLLEQELFKIKQYTDFVLNYLRLQSFHEDLVLEEVALEQVITKTVKKFSLFFIQKKIKLELGDLSGTIITDKKWFGLLVEQFLSNSVKYTKEGSISLRLEGGVLLIADTGIGISESDLSRVFERGFSGYNGRVSQQSSGLGLYVAKQIADQLGIGLAMTSRVGQGTQVSLDLSQKTLRVD